MNTKKDFPSSASEDRAQTPAAAGLALTVLTAPFAICRLKPDEEIPSWVRQSHFSSIARAPDELSLICEEQWVPKAVRCDRGWRAIQVLGPLSTPIFGVLASLTPILNEEEIHLFAISTFNSDYLFVRGSKLRRAITALERAGHRFDRQPQDAALPGPKPAPTATRDDGEEDSASNAAAADRTTAPAPRPRSIASPSPAAPRTPPTSVDRPIDDTPESAPVSTRTDAPVDKKVEHKRDTVKKDTIKKDSDKRLDSEPTSRRTRPRRDVSPKPARDDRDTDEGAESVGLFTGAIPQNPVAITDTSFSALGLNEALSRTIEKVGFKHPTPIQDAVIPHALAGSDVIGLAETGSGKTAAFVLPLVQHLSGRRGTRGLILSPTREIALQTKAFLDIVGRDHGLESLVVIGGVKMGPQIQGLRRPADILVATPGRLADHVRRRNTRLDKIEQLVLDEADHMLDLGFLPQIQEVLEQVPEMRQTMMFSATMPPLIARLANRFMTDPVRIDFRPEGHAAEGIEHRLYLVEPDDKKACLLSLLAEVEGSTLIFTRRRLDAEWLARQVEEGGFQVERIHSDRSQAHRVRALRAFREGRNKVLVATDVAARGIDIPRIEHVINYELPDQVEDYVHRAGRTARGNALGIVSSICTWVDKPVIKDIEAHIGIEMPRCEVAGVKPYAELKRRKQVRRRRLL